MSRFALSARGRVLGPILFLFVASLAGLPAAAQPLSAPTGSDSVRMSAEQPPTALSETLREDCQRLLALSEPLAGDPATRANAGLRIQLAMCEDVVRTEVAGTSPGRSAAALADATVSSISGTVTAEGGDGLAWIQAVACPIVGPSCFGATTASDGTYTIGGLAAGSYRVWFYDPSGTYARGYYGSGGFTPDYSAAALLTVPPDMSAIDVALPLGSKISGLVTAQGGTELGGIQVVACPATTSGICGSAMTAGDGTYSIAGFADGSYRVWFYDPLGTYARGYYSESGFTPDPAAATAVSVPPDRSGINVALPPGYKISGLVTAQGGGGIVGISVTACPFVGGGTCGSATTAGDGTYTIGGLAAGSYRVWFYDPTGSHAGGYYGSGGFTPDYSAAASLTAPPDRSGIDVALPPGYKISGTVTAGGAGGLAGISVNACPAVGGAMCGSVVTAADGSYTVGGLVAGSYRVAFYDQSGTYARGYYSESGFTPDASKATAVSVPPDAAGIDVALPPGYRISGTVTAEGDGGLAGIYVNACPAAGGGSCGLATTAADGTYTAGGLAAGSYRISFSDPTSTYVSGYYSDSGFTPDASKATPVSLTTSDVSGIDVTLPVGLRISGTVKGPGGTGLAGINVSSCPGASGPCGWAVTAGDGTYELRGLVPGSYRVWFSDPTNTYVGGYYSTSGVTRDYSKATPVSLTTSDVSGIDVTLPLGLHISGTVTKSGVSGLGGIHVSACDVTGGSCGSATTASDGTYALGGLVAGSYRVWFSDPTSTYVSGYYSTSGLTQDPAAATLVPVTTSDVSGVDVTLPLGLHISGTVKGPESTGLAGIRAKACLTGSFVSCSVVSTGATGAYAIGGLVAGSYRVSFSDPARIYLGGYYSTSGLKRRAADATPVTLTTSDVAGIDVALPVGFKIAGKVSGPAGVGLTGIGVSACPTAGGSCGWAQTATGGTYSVGALAEGTYRVQFTDWNGTYASGYYSPSGLTPDASAAAVLAVPPDKSGIDVTLPPALHISGTVTGPDGTGLPDVAVRACVAASGSCGPDWYTTMNGTYTVGRLPAGTYRLEFIDWNDTYASGYYRASGFTPDPSEATPVQLTTTDRAGIDIELPVGYKIAGTVTGLRGDPASRVTASACSLEGGWCRSADTDTEGKYRISGLIEDVYQVSFHDALDRYASGYYSEDGFTPDPAAATQLGLPPDAAGIDVELPGARHLGGRVTGPGGIPLQGIQVEACPTSNLEFCGQATTASDGTYSVGGLVRGSYEVAFTDPAKKYADGFYNTTGFSVDHSSRVKVYVTNVTGIDVQTWLVADPPTRYAVTSSNDRPKTGEAVTISAQLADVGGHPVAVAGMVVTWSLTGGDGSLAKPTSTTNADGVATVVFTMGSKPAAVRYVSATDEADRTGTVAISRRQLR